MNEKAEMWRRGVIDRDTNVLSELMLILKKSIIEHGYIVHADDIVQHAMMRILNNILSFKGKSKFTTWAITIAMNSGAELYRKEIMQFKLYEKKLITQWIVDLPMNEPDLIYIKDNYLLDIVHDMIKQQITTEEHWEMFKMVYLFDYSVKEVAEVFDMTENNVYRRCFNFKEKVKLFVLGNE